MSSKRLLTTFLPVLPRLSATGIAITRGRGGGGGRSAITPVLYHFHPTFRQSVLPKKYSTTTTTTTTQPPNTKLYDYEAIKSLTKTYPPTGRLIDVREPAEFAAGAIPTAINIPIASSPDALMLSPEEFEDRFGFAKPGLEEEVVFYCKAGIRSSAAAQVAVGAGYRWVGEYRGSWNDWERREKGI